MLFNIISFLLIGVLTGVHTEPVVHPQAQHIHSPASGSITCVFPTPLTGCKVRVSEHHKYRFDTLLDFGGGVQSPVAAINFEFNASYAGAGLASGECGLKVDIANPNGDVEAPLDSVMFVECFGRAEHGQWDRGFGLITSESFAVMPVTAIPSPFVVAEQGNDVSVLLRSAWELNECLIRASAWRLNLSPGEKFPSDSRFRPFGAGADEKDCGVTLTDTQISDAGVWHTFGGKYNTSVPNYGIWFGTVLLVRAAPTEKPVLHIKNAESLKVGNVLEAKCVGPPAVPPVEMVWLLDGQIVRHNQLNDTLADEVGKSRPWVLQPVHQTYRHTLKAEDNGKRLECLVKHPTLVRPTIAGHDLIATPTPDAKQHTNWIAKVKPTLKWCTNQNRRLNCNVLRRLRMQPRHPVTYEMDTGIV